MKNQIITKSIILGILIISSVFCGTVLKTCQNNASDGMKNIEFNKRWFQIGQLYAFCMQVSCERLFWNVFSVNFLLFSPFFCFIYCENKNLFKNKFLKEWIRSTVGHMGKREVFSQKFFFYKNVTFQYYYFLNHVIS